MAAAGDIADEDAARSAGAWVAVDAGLAQLRAAGCRTSPKPSTAVAATSRRAWLEGDVSRPQAEVIVAALDALPADLDPTLREEAERHLVAQAQDFGPRDLRMLGRRVLEVVAADVAEEHEAKALAGDERRARGRMSVNRHDLDDGLVRITAVLPVLHADLLLTQLHAYASPRRDHLDQVDRRDPESGDRVPYARLLAHGFCTMLERLSRQVVPSQGGSAATVLVTIDHHRLAEQLAVARLSTGTTITAGEARRLACNAGIVPVVLAGKSRPLDVGRAKRFHDSAQRTAMSLRDQECRAAGCDVPAAWCEAHHLRPWSAGGRTSVHDGVLLCGFHHHRAHDRTYDLTRLGNGDIRFSRRTSGTECPPERVIDRARGPGA